jgi:hypothetical protein
MTSPIGKLKDLIKSELLADETMQRYLTDKGAGVLVDLYSELGEQDVPCCVITAVQEDIERLSQDEMERSAVDLVIEFYAYQRQSLNFDDFAFHVRRLISTIPVREKLGSAFEGLQIERIAYDRSAIGSKPIQQMAFKIKTYYDIDLFENWTGGLGLSAITVQSGNQQYGGEP